MFTRFAAKVRQAANFDVLTRPDELGGAVPAVPLRRERQFAHDFIWREAIKSLPQTLEYWSTGAAFLPPRQRGAVWRAVQEMRTEDPSFSLYCGTVDNTALGAAIVTCGVPSAMADRSDST